MAPSRPDLTHPPPDAGNRAADWHALDAQRVLELLECDTRLGLTEAEAARRLKAHGPNALPEAPPPPWWRSLLRQFASPLIYLLFVAAALAAGLGHWGDAGVILVVVVVNALALADIANNFRLARIERQEQRRASAEQLAADLRSLRSGRANRSASSESSSEGGRRD